MDKSDEAFKTISEAADELDVPQHVLRFWETRFSQIRPMKRGGGRRYYRPDDVDLLKGIRALLYGQGFTIRGVQKILKEEGKAYVCGIGRQEIVHSPHDEASADAPPASSGTQASDADVKATETKEAAASSTKAAPTPSPKPKRGAAAAQKTAPDEGAPGTDTSSVASMGLDEESRKALQGIAEELQSIKEDLTKAL